MNVGSRQAAAIPFRRDGERLSFCLVTTSGGGKWTFPKGIIEPGATVRETALKEAFEEAGLHGTLVGDPIGSFEQTKWGDTFSVEVYLMDVTRATPPGRRTICASVGGVAATRLWCGGVPSMTSFSNRSGNFSRPNPVGPCVATPTDSERCDLRILESGPHRTRATTDAENRCGRRPRLPASTPRRRPGITRTSRDTWDRFARFIRTNYASSARVAVSSW